MNRDDLNRKQKRDLSKKTKKADKKTKKKAEMVAKKINSIAELHRKLATVKAEQFELQGEGQSYNEWLNDQSKKILEDAEIEESLQELMSDYAQERQNFSEKLAEDRQQLDDLQATQNFLLKKEWDLELVTEDNDEEGGEEEDDDNVIDITDDDDDNVEDEESTELTLDDIKLQRFELMLRVEERADVVRDLEEDYKVNRETLLTEAGTWEGLEEIRIKREKFQKETEAKTQQLNKRLESLEAARRVYRSRTRESRKGE
jgi:hypothetical protein